MEADHRAAAAQGQEGGLISEQRWLLKDVCKLHIIHYCYSELLFSSSSRVKSYFLATPSCFNFYVHLALFSWALLGTDAFLTSFTLCQSLRLSFPKNLGTKSLYKCERFFKEAWVASLKKRELSCVHTSSLSKLLAA